MTIYSTKINVKYIQCHGFILNEPLFNKVVHAPIAACIIKDSYIGTVTLIYNMLKKSVYQL